MFGTVGRSTGLLLPSTCLDIYIYRLTDTVPLYKIRTRRTKLFCSRTHQLVSFRSGEPFATETVTKMSLLPSTQTAPTAQEKW